MIISLALVLLATVSGTLTSYLYDARAALVSRLCAGACIGIAALGLVCFVAASFLGLTPLAITLSAVVLLLPVAVLRNPKLKIVVKDDLTQTYRSVQHTWQHPSREAVGYVVLYLVVVVVLWWCFQRAMVEGPEGIYTGVINNFGDLPFHISVITRFAFGNNFPPEDPTYAGVKFTYPFITDFVSAIFVRCGASLRQAMFLENFVVALAFFGLLHRWALVMVRDRLAAVITPLLVFLNGGLGWILLLQEAAGNHASVRSFLASLPASFTIIPDTTWRWGNAMSTLLIPQRGFLLGLPLAVVVFTQWWLAGNNERENEELEKEDSSAPRRKKSRSQSPERGIDNSIRKMIAAGVIAGLLPLVHAHSFIVVMVVGAGIALLQRRWRDWFAFFAAAGLVALPQLFWSTHNSAVDAAKFFEWQFGWDGGRDDFIGFWFKNSGLFIPLTVAALFWGGKQRLVSRRLLLFFLPFTLCFIVPNVLKMAPWIWDNIKVLFYWWVASAPLIALLLAWLWKQRGLQRVAALVLFVCITAAGALDVAIIMFRSTKAEVFQSQGISFAELIKSRTEPNALILHAPVHDHPVFLSGRQSLMGYPGHIWTHGLDFVPRESEIKRAYAGGPDAQAILRKYGINYIVAGPHERRLLNVNDQFLLNFQLVGEVGGYRIYKITQS